MPPQRVAVAADVPAIRELMRASVLDLFPAFYDARQTASAAVHIAHLDVRLVEDGTYYVHTVDDEMVACGGWSRRSKLYNGSGASEDDDRLLDPATEPRVCERCSCAVTGPDGASAVRSWIRASAPRAPRGSPNSCWARRLPGSRFTARSDSVRSSAVRWTMPDGVTVDVVTMKRAIAAA